MRNCVKRILVISLVLVMCIPAFSGMNVSAEKTNNEEVTIMMELPDLEKWHYKIPITIDTGDYNRTDCVLSQNIKITREIGGYGTFDNNSIRVIETVEGDTPLYEVVSQYRWINNDILDVTWIMNDTTPANTQRYYSIYFDILENGAKNATVYEEYIATKENSQQIWVYGDSYEIKIDKDRSGTRELKINNVPRKGYTLDNDWMSWYTPYINWGIKDASTTLLEDGPIYKTVKIVSSDNTQTIYWYFYPDRMKIVTQEEYSDVCFDTIADNLNNKEGALVWSDGTTENLTKDYKEYSKVTDFFYILDPELGSSNDDVKGRSGFWADTVDGRNQTIINAGEKGTRWTLNGSSAWFGFAKNEKIRNVVLRSQNPPSVTRMKTNVRMESPMITKDVTLSDQTIEVEGNLTIQENGNLTLKNIDLTVNGSVVVVNGTETLRNSRCEIVSESDGQHGIYVEQEGELYVYDSTITANTEYYYKFDVYGEAQIDGSKISYLYDGIRLLNGSDAVIQNCEIFNSKGDGIYIVGKTKPIIANNTIRDGSNAGIFIFDNGEEIWTKKTEMNVLPEYDGWTLFWTHGTSHIENGILQMKSSPWGTRVYRKYISAFDTVGLTVEMRTQVTSGEAHILITSSTGANSCRYVLFYLKPTELWMFGAGGQNIISISPEFHVFRITMKDTWYALYIDEVKVREGNTPSTIAASMINFEAREPDCVSYWDYVYYSTEGAFEPVWLQPVEGAGPWSIVAKVDEVVEFDGETYYDPASIENYSWDFDMEEGFPDLQEDAVGKTVTHVYENAGVYFVTLTVTDNMGVTDSCYVRVSVWNSSWWAYSGQTISNFTYGYYLSDASLNIAECTLFNNDYGIYCNNSSAAIITSWIFNNNINSIYISADSSIIPINAAYDRTKVSIERDTIDTDNDNWKDKEELYLYGFSPYHKDSVDADFDGDGITNVNESEIYGTDPLNPDTDNDGLTDKYEVDTTYLYSEIDWDGDGNVDYKTNPNNPDTDGDTLSDYDEVNGEVTRYVVDKGDKGYLFYKDEPLSYDKTFMYHTNPLDTDTDDDEQKEYNDLIPLDYDMDGDGYINTDMLVDSSSPCYVKRIATAVNNDPYLNRYADGRPIPESDTASGGDNDMDSDGLKDVSGNDLDMDSDGMSDVYEVKYGELDIGYYESSTDVYVENDVEGNGWQNPFVYNARYALLIGGDIKDKAGNNVPWFWNDIKDMYNMLIGKGWDDENVYVLFYDGCNQDGVNPEGIIDYAATRDNVRGVISRLENMSTKNDFLLFTVTSHGNYKYAQIKYGEGGLEFNLYYKETYPPAMNISEINNIPCARLTVVIESCNSGGVIRNYDSVTKITYTPLKGSNRIIISSSRVDKWSYSTSDCKYTVFLHGFITKLGSDDASIKSAFDKGKNDALNSNVPGANIQEPQLEDDGDCLTDQNNDPDINPDLGGEYIPGTYNDGLLASNTYI